MPQPLPGEINTENAGTPAISTDGNTLYFCSTRPGGYGEFDIWKSARVGGIWQSPVNLGPLVNTAKAEQFPSIAGNDTDLVFYRTDGSLQDTMNIWHIRLGTGDTAQCIFYGHYEPLPHYGSFSYNSPCFSHNGQKIYMTYIPFNTEPLYYIYSSSRPVGVDDGLRSDGESSSRLSILAIPNPAALSAMLSFTLPCAGAYSLRVFNIAGQNVKDLSGFGHTGTNNIKWSVSLMPNGVYLYQLGFEGKKVVKRMVVLK